MTAEPTPHVVTVAEHSVYEAICATCPWVSGGHLDPSWAEMAAQQHEKGHSVAREEEVDVPPSHALLLSGLPSFAGLGEHLVIPAGDTDGEWRPLKVSPGMPDHEYRRDGRKVQVRRTMPDLRLYGEKNEEA